MPPASTMAANNNNLDPFGQFGHLSLDPYSQPPATDGNNQSPTSSPSTPPNVPKSGHFSMMMTDVNAPPDMNTGYQYSNQQQMQQQPQPMQISPEHAAGALVQQQGHHQEQHQAVYSNYQYHPYAQPPPMQQPTMPYQANDASMAMPNSNAPLGVQFMTSPPISPLWTPASPEVMQMRQAVNSGMAPSMPTGFGNAQAPSAGGGVPVPTLSPGGNPFDMFDAAPAQVAPAPSAVPTDPFGNNSTAPAVQQQQTQQDDADFWNDMGFGVAAPPTNSDDPGNVTPLSNSDHSLSSVTSSENNNNSNPYTLQNQDHSLDDAPVNLDDRGLPAGGEYYNARVTTPMLGAIFSSAKELRSTLFKTASNSFVEAIGDRPVISFTIDGSAADTAGIGLGHVLLKVNGQEVNQTDQAVKTVGAAKRPMIMEFYVPNKDVKVVKTEGQCMVKYDNHSTDAPASACEWKAKYVVVGDMLGKPHILYMYRSKAEYDVAVKESQTRNRALSVKVKQFDIRGAKIFHEQGTVKYPNKPMWNYFTVVRGTGLPIKISARTAEELQPVYDGIVTFLEREAEMKKQRMEQTRERMNNMSGMYRETYY